MLKFRKGVIRSTNELDRCSVRIFILLNGFLVFLEYFIATFYGLWTGSILEAPFRFVLKSRILYARYSFLRKTLFNWGFTTLLRSSLHHFSNDFRRNIFTLLWFFQGKLSIPIEVTSIMHFWNKIRTIAFNKFSNICYVLFIFD